MHLHALKLNSYRIKSQVTLKPLLNGQSILASVDTDLQVGVQFICTG